MNPKLIRIGFWLLLLAAIAFTVYGLVQLYQESPALFWYHILGD